MNMKEGVTKRYIPRNLSFEEDYHEKQACSLLLRRTLCAARSNSKPPESRNHSDSNCKCSCGVETADMESNKNNDFDTLPSPLMTDSCPPLTITSDCTTSETESCDHRTYSTDSDNFSEDYTDVKDYENETENSSECFGENQSISEKLSDLQISTFRNAQSQEDNQDAGSDAGSSESGVTLKHSDELEDAQISDATESNPGLLLQVLSSSQDMGDHSSMYEDREFDFLKCEPVRRSVSLKTNKTPPGTPHRKKAVRFADVLGLDLESVRHILNLDAPPKIPASATADLSVGIEEDRRTEGSRYLTACFPQPGAATNFITRVIEEKVALENSMVDDQELTITGTVRVANIAYHKSVKVRYTTNNWLTFTDVTANYMANSCDGTTDRFTFTIIVPQYFGVGSRLQFAVSYTVDGQSFWDNNHGNNYVVECYARSFPTVETDNTWVHFL